MFIIFLTPPPPPPKTMWTIFNLDNKKKKIRKTFENALPSKNLLGFRRPWQIGKNLILSYAIMKTIVLCTLPFPSFSLGIIQV